MTKYAYIEEGVLRLHSSKKTAEKNGTIVEADLESNEQGLPVIDGTVITYYADTEQTFIDGDKDTGTEIPLPMMLLDVVAGL